MINNLFHLYTITTRLFLHFICSPLGFQFKGKLLLKTHGCILSDDLGLNVMFCINDESSSIFGRKRKVLDHHIVLKVWANSRLANTSWPKFNNFWARDESMAFSIAGILAVCDARIGEKTKNGVGWPSILASLNHGWWSEHVNTRQGQQEELCAESYLSISIWRHHGGIFLAA